MALHRTHRHGLDRCFRNRNAGLGDTGMVHHDSVRAGTRSRASAAGGGSSCRWRSCRTKCQPSAASSQNGRWRWRSVRRSFVGRPDACRRYGDHLGHLGGRLRRIRPSRSRFVLPRSVRSMASARLAPRRWQEPAMAPRHVGARREPGCVYLSRHGGTAWRP